MSNQARSRSKAASRERAPRRSDQSAKEGRITIGHLRKRSLVRPYAHPLSLDPNQLPGCTTTRYRNQRTRSPCQRSSATSSSPRRGSI